MCCIFVKIYEMDIQTRKLNAIEYIAGLEDENILNLIELTIIENKSRNERKIKPFTQKQLINRAVKSNKDYLAGKIIIQEDLEKQSKSW
jgi:hypothetical protein